MPDQDDTLEIIDTPEPWPRDGAGHPGFGEWAPDPRHPANPPDARGKAPEAEDAEAPGTKPYPEAKNDDSLRDELGVHLEELRRRLAVSLAVFIPFFALGLWLYRELWRVVSLPLERAAPHLLRFQALNPSDGLIMTMRIAFAFAMFLSLPVWLSQIWRFVAPGLTANELRWLHVSLGAGGILFAAGVAVAYFIGVPLALAWLLPFNQSLSGWENVFTGEGYVDFVLACCAGFGFAFELPLAMLTLARTGILTPESLKAGWRWAILAIFVLAALLTPPDPFTQLLLALPLLLLFGVGYWLAIRFSREEK
ncbi:MAG: twin-arginine translocase subunit TatC [Planctomycetota bacterium]|jgi:sec-independent protein translocase protein TatC|nr:twin-arginine translocase subunit TatC [Planctomycetota bacterium]